MKKFLMLAVLLMALVAALGFTSAFAADCAAPVSVDCTDNKGNTDPSDDEHCLVYVDIAEAGLKDCLGESDVPPPPAL